MVYVLWNMYIFWLVGDSNKPLTTNMHEYLGQNKHNLFSYYQIANTHEYLGQKPRTNTTCSLTTISCMINDVQMDWSEVKSSHHFYSHHFYGDMFSHPWLEELWQTDSEGRRWWQVLQHSGPWPLSSLHGPPLNPLWCCLLYVPSLALPKVSHFLQWALSYLSK